MEWVKSFLVYLITFLTVAPFVFFFGMWFVFYLVKKNKKKSTELAMDVTTFVLIISVSFMSYAIFNSSLGFWIIILLILLSAGFIGNVQNRIRGKIDLLKIYKVVWRISFVVLIGLYVIFLITGIIKNTF